jgi:hypothetical protein
VLWAFKKECLEHSRSPKKECPVFSGTSNNDLFVDFKLLIVKKCDFFPSEISAKK